MRNSSPFDGLSTILFGLGIVAIMVAAVGFAKAHSGNGAFDPFVSVSTTSVSIWDAAPQVRVNQLPQLR